MSVNLILQLYCSKHETIKHNCLQSIISIISINSNHTPPFTDPSPIYLFVVMLPGFPAAFREEIGATVRQMHTLHVVLPVWHRSLERRVDYIGVHMEQHFFTENSSEKEQLKNIHVYILCLYQVCVCVYCFNRNTPICSPVYVGISQTVNTSVLCTSVSTGTVFLTPFSCKP